MVRKITVDANVALKWFIDEDYSVESRSLLKAFRDGAASLSAPSILHYEVGNALWILASKRYRVDRGYAEQAYHRLLALPLEVVQLSPSDFQEALRGACELALTLYDASYLVAAKKTGSVFVTADRGLLEKAKKLVESIHVEELKT